MMSVGQIDILAFSFFFSDLQVREKNGKLTFHNNSPVEYHFGVVWLIFFLDNSLKILYLS